jgi:hypothetical protein
MIHKSSCNKFSIILFRGDQSGCAILKVGKEGRRRRRKEEKKRGEKKSYHSSRAKEAFI